MRCKLLTFKLKGIKKNVLRPFLFIGLGLVVATIAIAASRIIDVPEPPGVPKIREVTNSSCTIGYTAPYDDGGSPITVYLIEKSGNWNPFWSDAGTSGTTIHTVVNLIKGNEYEFRVSAANKVGISNPSGVSEFVTIQ